jgi:replicative DNA helicase
MIARMADYLPPQNIEAEQGVLGSVLLDAETIPDVADVLTADDFYRDAHQRLYRAIVDTWSDGGRVDCVTIADELTRRGDFDVVGREDYLAELCQMVPHAVNAKQYAQIVRQKAIARNVVEAANETLREAYSDTLTADDLLAAAERRFLAIGEHAARDDAATIRLAAAASLYRVRCRASGEEPGLTTGFPDLDDVLDGLQPRKLYVLAARPSIGKSALALNIADQVSTAGRGSVLFVSLEMDRVELADRYLMARAHVSGDRFRYPDRMTQLESDALTEVCEVDASRSTLVIDDPPTLTLTRLCARARRHKARNGLAMLVVDYLQLVDAQPLKGELREQQVARISRRLKSLARELSCPVMACCQLNRAVEGRADRKPSLADLRESGQIEQDADAVLLLHRPDHYDANDHPGDAYVIVAKNRAGRTGTVALKFIREQQRFEDSPL